MKVKLLRKLRKRFKWYKKESDTCWSYYDRRTNTDHYAFSEGLFYINDMLQFQMLSKIGLSKLYIPLRQRVESRLKARVDKKRKEKFAQYFND